MTQPPIMLDAVDADHRQPPRRHSKSRVALFDLISRACVALGGRRFYRRYYLGEGCFDIRHERVATIRPELVGLRFVQLSDIHAGPFLGPGDLVDVVEAANALAPDLIFITGDLIAQTIEDAWPILDDLARLKGGAGVFGVLGNHDYRGRRQAELVTRFGELGIQFLLNEGVRPLPDRPLFLLGVEDLEEARELDVAPARRRMEAGDFELILCHNPSGVSSLAGSQTGLVLSGHTHGGQINLPLVRGLGPAHPGDRVELQGLWGSVPLITNRGLGVVGVPLRFRARPEIVCIELVGVSP